jgi:hypothetical protein
MATDSARPLIVRWRDGKPSDIALLKSIKADEVWLEPAQPDFAAACAKAGIRTVAAPENVTKGGLWPGIRSAGRRRNPDTDVASASNEPWIDTNLYLVACERATAPTKTPLLAYTRGEDAANKMVPFESLEIALAEAWMMGGNFALELDDRYIRALRANDPKAQTAWTKLGRTAGWLKQNTASFGRPSLPVITALYDGRGGSRELANLLYRRNAAPRIVTAPPPPSPRIKALIAASITPPADPAKTTILAHAKAGAVVIVDADWWRDPAAQSIKLDADREIFSLGKGKVVAYKKRVADPSEFALDVIDLVTHRQRAVRLWNANTIVGVATEGKPNSVTLILLNYGTNLPEDIQVQVLGHFAKASMLAPGEAPVSLKTAKRAAMTEVFVPKLERACVIEFA